jgi:radical SAM-linked protein
MRFSPPASFGIMSESELLDFETLNCFLSTETILEALEHSLPSGLEPLTLIETSLNEKTVSANIVDITYEINFEELGGIEFVNDRIEKYRLAESVDVISERKGKKRVRNLKDWISDIHNTVDSVSITIKSGATGSLNPFEAVAGIFGIGSGESRDLEVVKKSVTLGPARSN